MDRIILQVQFRKVLWTCPFCLQEDYEDFNMSGGNTYVHICSKCSKQFNQSGTNLREFNGSLSYTQKEYALKSEQDISDSKDILVEKWVYDIKNPTPYVEPTKEQLEVEKAQLLKQVASLQIRIDAKTISEE